MSITPPSSLTHGFQETGDESIVLLKASPYSYVALAAPGTDPEDSSWKAFRYDSSTGRLQYADGDQEYDNPADDLASLSYL